jgi:metal-responsive CopG/Arc/MetJ family transcriptional regulator
MTIFRAIDVITMKIIRGALEEDLLNELDKIAGRLKTTRSAFTRRALKREIRHVRELDLIKKHIDGYKKKLVKKQEVDVWEKEQVWPDLSKS